MLHFFDNKYLNYLMLALIVFAAATILTQVLRFLLKRAFKRSSKTLKVDPTNYRFVYNMIAFIIFTAAVVVIFTLIPELKALGVTLLAGAGLVTVIIGFASQQTFANIISGLFIVIFKPFRVDDIIQIQGQTGLVEDITLRHIVIRNYENKRIIIPNSITNTETIINWHIGDKKICNFFEIGISYDSDIHKAMKIIQEEAMKHPHLIDNRTDEEKADKIPIVRTRVIGFGDSSVNLRAWIWSEDAPKGFEMRTDLNIAIKERFDREGIEIPFPYRTLIMKNANQNGK